MTSTASIRGILIGAGAVTRAMLPALCDCSWLRIEGVIDPDFNAAETVATTLGLGACYCWPTMDALSNDAIFDVAILNAPSHLHAGQVSAALNRGWDVLVAKPLTNSLADAVELLTLASTRGCNLAVAQQIPFTAHYQTVQQTIDSGRLGEIDFITFHSSKPRPDPRNLVHLDQPVCYEMCCHHYDLLLGFAGKAQPSSVFAQGWTPSWSAYNGPCMVNALIEFEQGLRVNYQAGFSTRSHNYELRIEGSEGTLRCRGRHFSDSDFHYEITKPGGDYESIDLEGLAVHDPWVPFLEKWHEVRETGESCRFNGGGILPTMELIDATVRSINSGMPATILDNPDYNPDRLDSCRNSHTLVSHE